MRPEAGCFYVLSGFLINCPLSLRYISYILTSTHSVCEDGDEGAELKQVQIVKGPPSLREGLKNVQCPVGFWFRRDS